MNRGGYSKHSKMTIADLCEDFLLVTDSCEVGAIREFLGVDVQGCDGFFVRLDADGGDYETVYGFEGIVPGLDKPVVLLYAGSGSGKTMPHGCR